MTVDVNVIYLLRLSIMDIGAGSGEFIKSLWEAGYTALAAHEIPGADLAQLKHIDVTVYQDRDWSSIPSGTFDIVTMLDVAEHVLDPASLFRSCFRILRRGGTVYFHTPIVTKVDRLMHYVAGVPVMGKLGRIWQRGRTSIFHLQNYTEASLMRLLPQEGFIDIHIDKRNELSWPITRYVRVYLCEKQNLPVFLAPLLAPIFYPLLSTNLMNANKAIVRARKP